MTTTPHVAIAIATFRRPAGLRRLLDSLDGLAFEGELRPCITVVVVDNDKDTAVTAADRASTHPLIYCIAPEQGLANVRNACLAAAPTDCEFIAFVDDDEWVVPGWLDALLTMQARTGADVVQGVVLPRYAAPAPEWMRAGHYHEVGPFTDGAPLDHGASGNVLIRRAAIGDVRFHPAFNRSGGEDVDFFHHLLVAGATMVAATRAIAYEDVPPDRSCLGWILRRRYRTGHTLGAIARRRGRRGPRALKAVGRLGFGVAESLAGAVSSRTRAVRGLANIVWGLGTLAALLGRDGQRFVNRPIPSSQAHW